LTRINRTPLRLEGKRVLVMGLGTRQGGVGVARYLVERGADVTVTDMADADALRGSISALDGLPIRYRLGEHRLDDFEQADLIVRNPGVPVDSPWLQRARELGIPVEMEMSLFFRECPAPVIGITGTKGKTTTASICADMLRRYRSDAVLAGNLGTSALDQLKRITPETPVVIELSSWQLEGLADYQLSPDIAVLTNISEDHLNRYASMEAYVDAKRHITRFQTEDNWFVVNRNDDRCWESRALSQARVIPFGILNDDEDGAGLDHDDLYWQFDGERHLLGRTEEIPLPGRHIVINVLAASAASMLAGADLDNVRDTIRETRGVPHRQELVATIDGVVYVNDTTATAPAAAIAALETFTERSIVLIAGGAGKGSDLSTFAEMAAQRADAIILLDGEETPALQRLLEGAGAVDLIGPVGSMSRAVDLARAQSRTGGVVLLSPGCASFGLFRDEFDRGDQFRDAVKALAGQSIGGRS
jgi:UDP-N-acetylmuramoylalanine--D-glutamate ligase